MVFCSSTVLIVFCPLKFISSSVKTGYVGFLSGSSASYLIIVTILVIGATIISSVSCENTNDPIVIMIHVNIVVNNSKLASLYESFEISNHA